jgi:hypothetical protein
VKTLPAFAASLALAACAPPPAPPVVTSAPVIATAPPRDPRCTADAETCDAVARLGEGAASLAGFDKLVGAAGVKDANDPAKPHVMALISAIAVPWTDQCLRDGLPPDVRAQMVRFLAEQGDVRAVPCWAKRLEASEPEATEPELRAIAIAIAKKKPAGIATPLLHAFERFHASRTKAQGTYRFVRDAMLALADPTWEPALIEILRRPLDTTSADARADGAFTVVTAIELLGNLRSAAAVRALLGVMLSPAKADAYVHAADALRDIGKPALAPTIALLRGEDAELLALARAEAKRAVGIDPGAEKRVDTAHVAVAAFVLGLLGRDECVQPMLDALAATKSPAARALIAHELPHLPHTAGVTKVFQAVYDGLPTALPFPGTRGSAREALLDVAPWFLDPSLVPWIVKSTRRLHGSDDDIDPIRERALEAVLKLATLDQIRLLNDLATMKAGEGPMNREYQRELGLAKGLLRKCLRDVDCYVGTITDPQANASATQTLGVKAAFQVGVTGDPQVRAKLVAALPRVTNASVAFTALSIVDALSPKGDPALADALQKQVDDAGHDPSRAFFGAIAKPVIRRLRARAEP